MKQEKVAFFSPPSFKKSLELHTYIPGGPKTKAVELEFPFNCFCIFGPPGIITNNNLITVLGDAESRISIMEFKR